MFKKLKDKIAEEVKSSPQRIQQFTQSVTEKIQNATSEENFFSIGDDDVPSSSPIPEPGFSNVSLSNYPTPNSERFRKNSNSSIASDMSFLPHYESSSNLYHLQSDLDVSASEIEDNASTSSQLGHLSKEQIYSAFQKSQMRYHKYRGRYTDIANHYKELERENAKMKAVLVETQDKALRRVSELREQCGLEQKAKAHLENALRVELDEKQYVIDTLKTKINLLQTNQGELTSLRVSESEDLQEVLTRDLKDARVEIETLNLKVQEMKANTIIFSSKETDMKKKINDLEETIKKKASENLLVLERERENNLIIAQTKMELHTEIQNRDLEIENLKHDIEVLRIDLNKYESEPKLPSNLHIQNAKLIEKVEELSERCKKYEGDVLKNEQQKIEIENLNESVRSLKAQVRILEEEKVQLNCDDQLRSLEALRDSNGVEIESLRRTIVDKDDIINSLNETNAEVNSVLMTLRGEMKQQAVDYEAKITTFREDTKLNLLGLEGKIEEKFKKKFDQKENVLRGEFQSKVEQLLQTDEDVQSIRLKLISKEEEIKKLSSQVLNLELKLQTLQENYTKLETTHLDLISENNEVLNIRANLIKQNREFEKEVKEVRELSVLYEKESVKLNEENVVLKSKIESLEEEVSSVQSEAVNMENILSENQTCKLEVENIKKEFQVAQGEKAEILNLQENLNKQIAVLQSEKDNLKTRNVDLQKQIEELKEVNENLSKSLEESKEVLSILRQQHVDVDVFKSNLNEELHLLKTELESKKQNLQQAQLDLEQVGEEKNNSITEVKLLNEKLILLEEEIVKLQANFKKASESLTVNQLSNSQREEELNNLRTNLDEVEMEKRHLKEKASQLQSDVVELNNTIINNEESATKSKLGYENLMKELENLKLEYESVIRENEELAKKFTTFTEQTDTFNTDIEKLQTQINELSREKVELYHETVNLQKAIENKDAIEDQNRIANSELVELRQKIEESTLEMENLKLQQMELQKTLEERTNEVATMKLEKPSPPIDSEKVLSENKTLLNQVDQLQETLNTFEKQKSNLEAQLRELENQYTDITHEKQLLQDEIQELKAAPVILTNSNDKNVENVPANPVEVNKVQTNHESQINDLHEKLVQYKSLDLTNRSSIQFYENELQRLKNKNEKLNRKLDETLVTLNHCTELSTSTETVYLKNVLYNYMLGKEGVVLARVIAAVCKFDDAQTETILQREQQKQTLLGQLGFL